jgi:hypothetical protein
VSAQNAFRTHTPLECMQVQQLMDAGLLPVSFVVLKVVMDAWGSEREQVGRATNNVEHIRHATFNIACDVLVWMCCTYLQADFPLSPPPS